MRYLHRIDERLWFKKKPERHIQQHDNTNTIVDKAIDLLTDIYSNDKYYRVEYGIDDTYLYSKDEDYYIYINRYKKDEVVKYYIVYRIYDVFDEIQDEEYDDSEENVIDENTITVINNKQLENIMRKLIVKYQHRFSY